MKRLACLLMLASIAYVGCAVKKQSTAIVVSDLLDGVPSGTWDYTAAIRRENAWLWAELNKATRRKRPVVTISRIDELEKVLLSKISELQEEIKTQSNALESAEVAIEAQRVTIEVLEKLCHLYAGVLESQKVTIEILKKICRLYGDEVVGS